MGPAEGGSPGPEGGSPDLGVDSPVGDSLGGVGQHSLQGV